MPIIEEMKSLDDNRTWEIVQKQDRIKILDCRRIFALKTDDKGNILRYKVRLVAKGFTQFGHG